MRYSYSQRLYPGVVQGTRSEKVVQSCLDKWSVCAAIETLSTSEAKIQSYLDLHREPKTFRETRTIENLPEGQYISVLPKAHSVGG